MSLRDRLTTSARVALAVTSVLVAGVVALSLLAYGAVATRLSADTDRALLREAEAYAAAIGPRTGRTEPDLLGASRAYLTARASAGADTHPVLLVRFVSRKVLSNTEVPVERAPANDALLEPATAQRRFALVSLAGREYRVATVPVLDARGTPIAVFEAALSTQPARDLATQLGWTLFGAGMAVVVVGAALSALVARGSLGPLRKAALTASAITHASLGRRIDYHGPDDEVGRMVASLNGMLERLEAGFSEQRRFVADASHELRTPLAVVRGHLDVLDNPAVPEAERAESLALILDELGRMNRLVDDLLQLARLEAGPSRSGQPLDVGTLLAEAVGRCRALRGCPVRLGRTEPLWVEGDPDLLGQAVLNLLRNALEHTPPRGVVTASCRAEGEDVVIEVCDDGPGVRRSDLPRIFDRFYRAPGPRSAEGGGSGLGLAITKRLVELHGGSVSAANRTGAAGAVFTVRLPRIEEPATDYAEVSLASSAV